MSFTCTSSACGPGTTFNWFLDAGMTVGAGFTNYASGDVMLNILSQNSDSDSLADLAGEWGINKLSSDSTWERMVIDIYGDGSYTQTETDSDGTTSTIPDFLPLIRRPGW